MSLSDISTTISLDLYDHDLTPSKIKAIALDSKTRYVNAQFTKGGTTSIYNNAIWGIGITESNELTSGYVGKY